MEQEMKTKEEDALYLMSTYKKKHCFDSGKGIYLFDHNGNKYIDLIGGIATCTVGHGNKEVVKAIKEQASKMINSSNLFYSTPQVMLGKKLCEITGMGKCFFSNSGTEANEAAIKLARKNTGKEKIIAMKNGFHGRTFGSLSATWNPNYKNSFGQLVPGFVHVEYGNIEDVKKELDDKTAAVILEPIQGEAGVILASEGYLKEVEKLCKEKKALLIFDEVQTGNGRTGKYFAYQNYNLQPDIVTTAKGLANGIPIGATIAKQGLDFSPKEHGSTFGGNNLACAGALKTIEIIEKLLPDVSEKGDYFISKLKAIKSDKIKEVRGKGLMIGIELKEKDENLGEKCKSNGIIVNVIHDDTIRMLPALIITKKDIDKAVKAISKSLS